MNISDSAHVFLPCWRQGRLLFFTDVKEGYTNRLDYRVAAATKQGSTKVERTFKAAISLDQLKKCQATADDGPGLQRFFKAVGGGNLDSLTDTNRLDLPPCAEGASPLIYICSYLNLLRKYSVDQTMIALYEAKPVAQRFDLESSLAVYKMLSAHLQPERAGQLIDADIADPAQLKGASNAVSNLLREAAIIKYDSGNFEQASTFMLRAVGLSESEDKWRRLADFSIAAKAPQKAIAYLEKAENITPLAPPPALKLAGLLIEDNRPDDALPLLERAEATMPAPVANLRKKMAALAEAPHS